MEYVSHYRTCILQSALVAKHIYIYIYTITITVDIIFNDMVHFGTPGNPSLGNSSTRLSGAGGAVAGKL